MKTNAHKAGNLRQYQTGITPAGQEVGDHSRSAAKKFKRPEAPAEQNVRHIPRGKPMANKSRGTMPRGWTKTKVATQPR